MVSLKKILNKILVRINSEADYVVERGQLDGWDYIKWKSGKAECFWDGEKNYWSSGAAIGNLYKVETSFDIPTEVITFPEYMYISPTYSDDNIIGMGGSAINRATIECFAWTTTSGRINISASYHLIGYWG